MQSTGNAGHVPTKPSGNGTHLNNLFNRLEASKKEAVLILQDVSNWPKDSATVVKEIREIIGNAPTLQEERFRSPSISSDVQGSIERFTLVMEDVCARLNKTYKKYGSNRELADVIMHPFSSLSKDGCETALLKCKNDVAKALTSLQDHLKDETAIYHSAGGQDDTGPSAPNKSADHPTEDTGTTSSSHGSSAKPNLGNSPEEATPAQQPAPSLQKASLNDQNQLEQAAARRRERLDVARTTFETIEKVSGAIPVVGSYIGAGAQVGLAVVNIIEAMDSNREIVKDLETRTTQLSELLGRFKDRSVEHRREEFLRHLTELQSELQAMRDKIGELSFQGTLRNVFCSGSQAEALKGYQNTIRVALEELQMLVSLNTAHLLNELYDGEVRKEQRRLLNCLGDASYGARGNAIEEVVCLPGTRVELLERIDDWMRNPSPSERVLWIRGMAGRGKSTIASTVVNNWRYRAAFAIFHFRRGQNASDKRLVCSLARQLGSSMVAEVKEAILQSIGENEDIAQERLQDQFKALFVASAERLQHTNQPILIVVDALDECEDTKYAVDFVNLVHQHTSSLSASFKFLLTTRPEAPLLRILEPRRWRTEDLDAVSGIDDDIAELLQLRLSETRENHDLGPEWPPQSAILSLVKMSQGLFQWAQTAVEYISEGSPELRLEELLESPSLCEGLDSLYAQIFSRAYEKANKRPGRGELLLQLLGTLATAPYPVSPEVFTYLSSNQLMFRNKSQQQSVQLLRLEIACDIRSVVYLPDSPSQPMRLVHTSVRDLLSDKRRCGVEPYFINIGLEHRNLTIRCFDLMERDLRQNICSISDLSKSNNEIQAVVEREVEDGLRYCCRSWSMHLVGGDWSSERDGALFEIVLNNLKRLSETKLLCWLEVMSLVGATLEAMAVANQVSSWLSDISGILSDPDLPTIWNDAYHFIATFLEPISFGAVHIYASALPFCPTGTKMWEYYGSQATNRILHGPQDMAWSQSLWSRTAEGIVQGAVFLRNGGTVAFGTDRTVQLWDSQTGTKVGEPLVGHSDWVTILAISPDGQTLASGSRDSTICLWNAEAGNLLFQPLCGHTDGVVSLTFSLDCKILLSTAYDFMIRFWDCQTGLPLGEPIAYSSFGYSPPTLSPDAKILASAIDVSGTLRLWDTQTGTQLGEPLVGHSWVISCLAFSPDSNILASGCYDEAVRLWDSKTGASIHSPLIESAEVLPPTQSGDQSATEINTNVCYALAFSPDGNILASASWRDGIKLWNVNTGTQCGQYRTSHTYVIASLAFSPNGKFIASGSWDETIQVCNVQTAPPTSAPIIDQKSHGRINAIALFPRGKILISGGNDQQVRSWDFPTGEQLNEHLTGHNRAIRCIAFSPDGTVLASGFADGTLCLWNAKTWRMLVAPLNCQGGLCRQYSVFSRWKGPGIWMPRWKDFGVGF